ncbi:MAG TPA: GAF domain-containing protein [Terriglobales bacterium]|nr:GAF domain-containing protein [Terriglobales bacterium]
MATTGSENHETRGRERRRQCRKNVVEHQLVTVELGDGQTAILVDLSADGFALQPFLPIKLGTQIRFEFDLPRGFGRIHGFGTVVWVGRTGRVGIRFAHLAERSSANLERWLGMKEDPIGDAIRNLTQASQHKTADSATPGTENSPSISDDLDFDTALALVVERACTATRATGAALILAGPSGFVCRASVGTAPEPGTQVDLDSGLTAQCLREGTTVNCPDATTDPRVNAAARDHLKLRSILAVPIQVDHEVIGAIEVLCSRVGAFNDRDIAKLEQLAELAADLDPESLEVIRD